VLKKAEGVPRQFRHTNREPPSKPSSYIVAATNPLRAYLDKHSARIAGPLRAEWALVFSDVATVRFRETIEECLKSVRKTEESLAKLKKKNKQTEEGMTDGDKIRLQFLLDVQAYGKQLSQLGMDVETNPEFTTLLAIVQSASGPAG
jgi:hypothetical protein